MCSFVSTPDPVGNKYYLGPAPLEDMAMCAAEPFDPLQLIVSFVEQLILTSFSAFLFTKPGKLLQLVALMEIIGTTCSQWRRHCPT
jgi:hypothetical protein